MSKKSKHLQTAAAIILSVIIWILPIVMPGKAAINIFSGGPENFDYLGFRLGKTFFILFLIYNIIIAVYSKKKGKSQFFKVSCIANYIPMLIFIFSYLLLVTLSPFEILTTLIYFLSLPGAAAVMLFKYYDDSMFLTCVAAIVILLSPVIGKLIYKRVKSEN